MHSEKLHSWIFGRPCFLSALIYLWFMFLGSEYMSARTSDSPWGSLNCGAGMASQKACHRIKPEPSVCHTAASSHQAQSLLQDKHWKALGPHITLQSPLATLLLTWQLQSTNSTSTNILHMQNTCEVAFSQLPFDWKTFI